jgi:hypothetical protein
MNTKRCCQYLELFEPRLVFSSVVFVRYPVQGDVRELTVDIADIDGDGDGDLFESHYDGSISWRENNGETVSFGAPKAIGTVNPGSFVAPLDLDGDGDLDVLAFDQHAYRGDAMHLWFENMSAEALFQRHELAIEGEVEFVRDIVDIDGDGDIDIVVQDSELRLWWLENRSRAGTLSSPKPIAAERTTRTLFVDLDQDGDIDVITNDCSLIGCAPAKWYENADGVGTFVPHDMGLGFQYVPIAAVDLDSDGDLDLITQASLFDSNRRSTGWHANIGGGVRFGPPMVLWDDLRVVTVIDIDGDGDYDMLTRRCEHHRCDISWFANDAATFSTEHIILENQDPPSVVDVVADINLDERIDLCVRGRDSIVCYENRVIGDSNNDGVFDSADLATVFRYGKYEIGHSDNVTFDQGDWNQDGAFDSSDVVLAFQAGHYETTARPLAAEIAAAVELISADIRPRVIGTPRRTSSGESAVNQADGNPWRWK